MKSTEIRRRFLDFFVSRDHLLIPDAPLIPEYDPTLLFTNSGMAPLKPYFLGLKEPPAERLVNIQRCLRTEDLEVIGDAHHHTFFLMLGSWSINGYGKREAVAFAWQLLTDRKEGYGFPPGRLYATVFAGDKDLPADEETVRYWREVGLENSHLLRRPAQDNLWVSGPTGPCGPCTEVLYDRGKEYACGPRCNPTCDCGRFYEIWNAGVFMQYNRTAPDRYEKLPFLSVDTGAGLERLAAILQETPSNYETDLFLPLILILEKIAEKRYAGERELARPFRIVVDHLRAAVFLAAEGILPSNVERGYVLRKLIRRAAESGLQLGMRGHFLGQMAEKVVELYGDSYPHLQQAQDKVLLVLTEEEDAFAQALARGFKELARMQKRGPIDAFKLFDTYGLPATATVSYARSHNWPVDLSGFEAQMKEQQVRARAAARKESYEPEKIKTAHTGAHLLNAALRQVLGSAVHQAGQKISPGKIRHDFTYGRPLSEEELKEVEELVNEKVRDNLPVAVEVTTLAKARQEGAEALFEEKYRSLDKVTLYRIGDFSRELCGGPHAGRTGELKQFKIEKQASVGRGVRRLYAAVSG